jgi:hypothetical protein
VDTIEDIAVLGALLVFSSLVSSCDCSDVLTGCPLFRLPSWELGAMRSAFRVRSAGSDSLKVVDLRDEAVVYFCRNLRN